MEKHYEVKMGSEQESHERANLFAALSRVGIIKEQEGGTQTWDIEALKKLSLMDLGVDISDKRSPQFTPKRIFTLLKGEMVLSEHDYRKNEHAPKQLFYYPEKFADAFDGEKIKENTKHSYVGPWDVRNKKFDHWKDVIKLPSGETVPMHELFLAQKIYGDFDGHRDPSTGSLKVVDPKTGNERNFSSNWLRKNIQFGHTEDGNKFSIRPVDYLLDVCPNLLENGLLLPKDIGSTSRAGDRYRRECVKLNSSRGEVYIAGASYTLGSMYAPHKRTDEQKIVGVYQLSSKEAGIVIRHADGTEEISEILRLKTDAEKRERGNEAAARLPVDMPGRATRITASTRFNKGEVDIYPYREGGINTRFRNETDKDYVSRMRSIPSFETINKIIQSLCEKTRIDIVHRFSWLEQEWLAMVLNRQPQHVVHIIEEAKKPHGENFLHAFATCAYDIKDAEKIIKLSQNLSSADAKNIFDTYRRVQRSAEDATPFLQEYFSDMQDLEGVSAHMFHDLMERGRDSILRCVALMDRSAKQKAGAKDSDIADELEYAQKDIDLLLESFRVVREVTKKPLLIEDITAVQLTRIHEKIAEDRPDLHGHLRELYGANCKREMYTERETEDLLIDFDTAFHESITSPEKSRVYILEDMTKLDRPIIAFIYFTNLPDGSVYVGGFNVAEEYQGTGIGAAIIDAIAMIENRKRTLVATCDPSKKISTHYIGKQGFVGTRYEVEDNAPSLHIERSSEEAGKLYESKLYPLELIVRRARPFDPEIIKNDIEAGRDTIVCSIPEVANRNSDVFMSVFDILNDRQYVLTKYDRYKGSIYCVFEKKGFSQTKREVA